QGMEQGEIGRRRCELVHGWLIVRQLAPRACARRPARRQKAQEPAIAPAAAGLDCSRCGAVPAPPRRLPPIAPFSTAYIVNLFLYLLTVLIWGSTWMAIKLQLGVVAIPVSILYRFALASVVMLAGLAALGRLQRLSRYGHLLCLGQGLCLFCLNFLCFYSATQWISSGLVS